MRCFVREMMRLHRGRPRRLWQFSEQARPQDCPADLAVQRDLALSLDQRRRQPVHRQDRGAPGPVQVQPPDAGASGRGDQQRRHRGDRFFLRDLAVAYAPIADIQRTEDENRRFCSMSRAFHSSAAGRTQAETPSTSGPGHRIQRLGAIEFGLLDYEGALGYFESASLGAPGPDPPGPIASTGSSIRSPREISAMPGSPLAGGQGDAAAEGHAGHSPRSWCTPTTRPSTGSDPSGCVLRKRLARRHRLSERTHRAAFDAWRAIREKSISSARLPSRPRGSQPCWLRTEDRACASRPNAMVQNCSRLRQHPPVRRRPRSSPAGAAGRRQPEQAPDDRRLRVSVDLFDCRCHVRHEADAIGRVGALQRPDRVAFELLILTGAGSSH